MHKEQCGKKETREHELTTQPVCTVYLQLALLRPSQSGTNLATIQQRKCVVVRREQCAFGLGKCAPAVGGVPQTGAPCSAVENSSLPC